MEISRESFADLLRLHVIGPDYAQQMSDIFETPGKRWFDTDRPIRRIHSDPCMLIAGVRSVIFQGFHPIAVAGFVEHSNYENDPWGRIQRTIQFVTTTTFGPADKAQEAVDIVQRVHSRIQGTTKEGIFYKASDPHLMNWVHCCEVDSFLHIYNKFGECRLTRSECDDYVEDMSIIASALNIKNSPRTVSELKISMQNFQKELRSLPEARKIAAYLVAPPSLPLRYAPIYRAVTATAVSTLPWWSRIGIGLPYTPILDKTAIIPTGQALSHLLRWMFQYQGPPPCPSDSSARNDRGQPQP
jgi:uncharacterized protein (DUF2236 family)